MADSFTTALAGAALGAALAAAASMPASAQQSTDSDDIRVIAGVPVTGEGNACAWTRTIDGFKATGDDDYIILTGIGDDAWLARLVGAPVADPDFAISAALNTRTGRVCGNGFDELLIDGDVARIMDMWKVVPAERAAAVLGEAPVGDTGQSDGWSLDRQ